jgi:hypothetical protein
MITGVKLVSQWPIARGGYAEIYHAQYMRQDVAVKCWFLQENGVHREEAYQVS